jgi:hypothetical protein
LVRYSTNVEDLWVGLEDCIDLLKTGRYEVLTRTEDGARFVFPITEPELHNAFDIKSTHRPISCIDDFTVVIPTMLKSGYHGWSSTDDFILHMRPDNLGQYYDKIAYVGRFSYEPESREFLPDTIQVAHNNTIRNYGTYPFNNYVRGIYSRENRLILIRAYFNPLDKEGHFDSYMAYDPDMDREKTIQTLKMLSENGLPDDVTIITRANNELIKNTCLKSMINFI